MRGIAAFGLAKRFGQFQALNDVELYVEPGEIVGLVGPNGAGKSTLLRVLGTTLLPDGGHASVGGHDVVEAPREARRAAGLFLPEERSFYWRLTGRANLAFYGAMHGLSRRRAANRADALLAQFGLEEVADRPVAEYSSGMRLRLSLGRALLGEPVALLLDEPTRSLDLAGASAFREFLVEFARQYGMAVLLVTHDLEEAAALASRVSVLADGRIAAEAWGRDVTAPNLERALLDIRSQ